MNTSFRVAVWCLQEEKQARQAAEGREKELRAKLADAVAAAVSAAVDGTPTTLKLSTIKMGADNWRQYRVKIDPEAGEVRVHIRSGVVEIHDEGPGMDSHEVGRAFEAFYRGRSTARGGSSGYGVGLTIVRRLSDRFDWPLAVDSTPGVGTSVLVRFPKFEEAGQAD